MSAAVEDSCLDDFFAKKDKKKAKKTKTDPAEKSDKKPKKTKEKTSQPNQENAKNGEKTDGSEKVGEDWLEIEEQGETDYSGLKIQSLKLDDKGDDKSLQDVSPRTQNKDGRGDDDSQDEEGGVNGVPEGPWKKIEIAPLPTKEVITEVVMEKSSKESTPTGVYVPPSLRAAQQKAAAAQAAPLRRRNPKQAPDMNSEESFPALGGPRSHPSAASTASEAPKSYTSLQLQNKWDTLSRGTD